MTESSPVSTWPRSRFEIEPFREQIVKVILTHVEMRAELLTSGCEVEPPVGDEAGRAERIIHPIGSA